LLLAVGVRAAAPERLKSIASVVNILSSNHCCARRKQKV
jgi:hypothetical protein